MKNIELVVLQHGLWGNKDHMGYIHDRLVEALKDKADILNVDVNEAKFTYDGIDICGERLAEKIQDHIATLATKDKRVVRISMVGYSLGGLITRYAIGILGEAGLFDTVEPGFYVSFATPHIGVRMPTKSVFARIFNTLSSKMVSRTGEQIQLRDEYDDKRRPLLSVLADPDGPFYLYLGKFKSRRTYANVDNDRTVPYWTAALEVKDYFDTIGKLDIELDESYSSIITSFGYRDPSKKRERKNGRFSKSTLLKYGLYLLSPILLPIVISIALTYIGTQGLASRYRTSRILRKKRTLNDGSALDGLQKQNESTSHSASERLDSTVSGHSENVLDDTLAKTLDIVNIPKSTTHAPQRHASPHDSVHTTTTYNVAALKSLEEKSGNLLLDATTLEIHGNLSQLNWEKVLVYIETINAHGSIVCRQKRFDNPGGRAVIKHFVDTISS